MRVIEANSNLIINKWYTLFGMLSMLMILRLIQVNIKYTQRELIP